VARLIVGGAFVSLILFAPIVPVLAAADHGARPRRRYRSRVACYDAISSPAASFFQLNSPIGRYSRGGPFPITVGALLGGVKIALVIEA
jgi:hypothetical protein